jgi:hypothetical protein|nr:MAG TPA: protein of unknown function (DUF5316) [Bacteriophage sp.]DAY34992.1 MAG TPA: protein of unknown function (DUF5316) [Bacteriophage sp.]
MALKIYFLIVAILFVVFIGIFIVSYKNGLANKEGCENVEDLIEKYVWLSMLASVAWPVLLTVILSYRLFKPLVFGIKKIIRD